MFNSTVIRGLRAAVVAALFAAPAFASGEVPLGDDGLHKPDWLQETFLDLREDLADATASGKRMMIIIEQKGCIYCTKMHEKIFPDVEIDAMIRDNFFVVQLNMFGALEVTDFDGEVLSERDIAQRWGAIFTPTMIFLPEEVPEGQTAVQAAVAVMPGAFERGTTLAMFNWVYHKAYETQPNFQKYFAENFYSGGSN